MIKRMVIFFMFLCFSSISQAVEWTTSVDLRERYQSFNNYDFNSAVDNSRQEFNSRLYIKSKGDFGNGLTVFFQPQAIVTKAKSQASGTQNFSQADLQQAYLQYDRGDIGLRIGRQELVYGDQRLLGNLGWQDVSRTFDGVKAMYNNNSGLSIDAFVVHPADIVSMTPSTASPQGKSLVTWEDRRLLGFYATYKVAPTTGIDTYLINWTNGQQAAIGKGRNFNTFGARGFGKWGGFDTTAEAVFQRGTWKTGTSQKASAYAVKAGYTFDAWKTRLGIEYDYSPGDATPGVGNQKDFVFPYHTNHALYGEMDFFSWANMKDVILSAKTSPKAGLSFIGNVHFLSLDKATGDWRSVAGVGKNVFDGKSTYTQTKAGTEIDLKAVYKVAAMKGLKLVGLYGIFNPGAAVAERNAGKADAATFAYLIAQYIF